MKKQLSTAMAAAMAFGTVVPAFTSEVSAAENLSIIDNVKRIVDMRLASGLQLVGADGKVVASANQAITSIVDLLPEGSITVTTNPTVSTSPATVSARMIPDFAQATDIPVLTRAQVYNYNGENVNDTDKHTLKPQFAGCEFLYQKLDPTNPANDLFVLAKPVTSDSDKLAAKQAKIEEAQMRNAIEGLELLGYQAKTNIPMAKTDGLLGKFYFDGENYVEITADNQDDLLVTYDSGVKYNTESGEYEYYQGREVVIICDKDGKPLTQTKNGVETLVTFTFANKNQETTELDKIRQEIYGDLANLDNGINVIFNTDKNTFEFNFDSMVNIPATGAFGETKRTITAEEERQLYHAINQFKYRLEQNKDKIAVVKQETGTNNRNTVAKVYLKDSEGKVDTSSLVMTMNFYNTIEADTSKIVTIPDLKDTDFGHITWAKDEIVNAMLAGYIDTTTEFRPKDNITRAEFAKIVCTVFGIDTNDKAIKDYENPFSDIKEDEWHYKYITALYNTGGKDGIAKKGAIINGYTDGTFKPKEEITRQEAAKMVAAAYDMFVEPLNTTGENAVEAKMDGIVEKKVAVNGATHHIDTKTVFADDSQIPEWADESVTALVKENILKGYEDNTFQPKTEIKRVEALYMLVKTNKITADDSDVK